MSRHLCTPCRTPGSCHASVGVMEHLWVSIRHHGITQSHVCPTEHFGIMHDPSGAPHGVHKPQQAHLNHPCPRAPHRAPWGDPRPCAPHGALQPHAEPWGDPRFLGSPLFPCISWMGSPHPSAPRKHCGMSKPLCTPPKHPWISVHPIRSTLGSPCSHIPQFGRDCPSTTTCGSTPPGTSPPKPSIPQAPLSPQQLTNPPPPHLEERSAPPQRPRGRGGGSHPITCGGDVMMGHPHGSMAPGAATAGARTRSGNARGDMQ